MVLIVIQMRHMEGRARSEAGSGQHEEGEEESAKEFERDNHGGERREAVRESDEVLSETSTELSLRSDRFGTEYRLLNDSE